MIEIKELVIKAVVDTKAEKPRDINSINSEKPDDSEVSQIVEQIIEDLNNKNER
jgi:hypothetical protein